MITDAIEKYLHEIKIPLRLSVVTESGWPFILSLWYIYMDRKIHLATPAASKVVNYLKNDPRCAFEIASDIPPYCGVRGQAKATIDESNGIEILKKLLNRYLGGLESKIAKNLLSRRIQEVSIILEPVNIFTWNFHERMKDSVASPKSAPCPITV